jgi:uncharacterized protein
MIRRETYLSSIRTYQDKPLIKILTGLRRVGKSVLLDQYIEELTSQGIHNDRILKLNFELPANYGITDFEELTKHVLIWAEQKTGPLYLFLDEVGRIKDWEKAVNGFHAMGVFDIYITGSNADLLSSDLSTYLAGRYIEILIHPLSYQEFILFHPQSSFMDYVTFGGFPSITLFNLDYEPSMNTLRDSFRSAVFQDVISRHSIRNPIILEKLIQYLFANTAKTFSALSIANYFKSQKINVSVDTILNYLRLLSEAFLIYKVMRQDIVGKNLLKTEEKYYIADHGLREALVGNNGAVIELILENIVYIELLRRGYKVHIGKINQVEIDFVAIKGSDKSYYQVCYLMESDTTRVREFGNLELIKDNFAKYVISMDQVNFSQNGIIHKNIVDFLLGN